jgi:hypothetical protein
MGGKYRPFANSMRIENYVYLPRIDAQIYSLSNHSFKCALSPREYDQLVVSGAQFFFSRMARHPAASWALRKRLQFKHFLIYRKERKGELLYIC